MERSKLDEERNILLSDAKNYEDSFKSTRNGCLDWKVIAIAVLLLFNIGLVAEIAWQTPKQLLRSSSPDRKNGRQWQKIGKRHLRTIYLLADIFLERAFRICLSSRSRFTGILLTAQ